MRTAVVRLLSVVATLLIWFAATKLFLRGDYGLAGLAAGIGFAFAADVIRCRIV